MILQDPPIANSCSELDEELGKVNLAIVSDSPRHRQHLEQFMTRFGLRVVINERCCSSFFEKMDQLQADVILLDVDEASDKQQEFINMLLDSTDIPIIFNDVTGLSLNEPKNLTRWYKTLLSKIADLTGRREWESLDLDMSSQKTIEQPVSHQQNQQASKMLAENIWILGASLGGPDAVKRFLSLIPPDLPVAFILAQHLGENFVTLLAEQLDRLTPFKVMNPRTGHVLKHGEVLVVPIEKRLMINPIGAVELKALTGKQTYSPSIDLVMSDFAEKYAKNAGSIIFSGMCNDGVSGCIKVKEQGGEVWIQSPDSCVIGAMPENVSKDVSVDYMGTPEELAQVMINRYM